EAPAADVSGLVSHPETTRAGREYLSTFVNGRYVTAGSLREAVLDAYGGQLAADRYPFAVLFVEVPSDAVDVNVHPRKMEVRFDDEAAVTDAVTDAVRAALLDHGLVRSTAPRGRSAPAETAIDPVSPEREVAGGEAAEVDEFDPSDHEASGDAADEAPETRASTGDTTRDATLSEVTEGGDDADGDAETRASADSDGESRERETPTAVDADAERDATDESGWDATDEDERPNASRDDAAGDAPERGVPAGVVSPSNQRTLDGERAAPDRAFDRLPAMRVLGQLDETYLVAETADGLALIDQHAADERINYERLRAEMDGETPTQALAEPVDLELTAREAELFDTYRDALAELGFHADRTDDRIVEVRTVPTVFDTALDPSLLRDALTGFPDGTDGETVDAVADALLADLACYPSITGNTSLTEGSVVDLLDSLDDCENPFACPHGRPVVVAIDRDEIAERFERDYPGHGGRRPE
ncbi:MAG: DNA mismatch repair endonuclease MutL, partial [Haloplanus sp.]